MWDEGRGWGGAEIEMEGDLVGGDVSRVSLRWEGQVVVEASVRLDGWRTTEQVQWQVYSVEKTGKRW